MLYTIHSLLVGVLKGPALDDTRGPYQKVCAPKIYSGSGEGPGSAQETKNPAILSPHLTINFTSDAAGLHGSHVIEDLMFDYDVGLVMRSM